MIFVNMRSHIHIQSRIDRLTSRVFFIFRNAMRHTFFDPVGVADYKSRQSVPIF